jgi:hypothetical protein
MIRFKRTKARQWRGNGFGYSGAEYVIMLNGAQIGTIDDASLAYGWRARLNDGRVIRSLDGKLATLKRQLQSNYD